MTESSVSGDLPAWPPRDQVPHPNPEEHLSFGEKSKKFESGLPIAGPMESYKTGIPSIPWQVYVIGFLMCLIAFFNFGIPRLFLLPLSAFIFLSLISKSLQSPLPILVALAAYIPYSKSIAGNMGGAVTGLNYTTALTLIGLISIQTVSKKRAGNHEFSGAEPVSPFEQFFRRLVIIFCCLGAFSVIHTDIIFSQWTFFTAILDYKQWIDPFLIFFIFSYLISTESEAKIVIATMAITLVFIGLGSIWQHHVVAGYHHRVRLKGIAGQANQMGAFYSNYIFILLGFFTMKGLKLRSRALFAIGMVGCFLGLMATESRGDALALVFAVLAFFFFRNKMLFIASVGLIAFLALNIQFLPQGLRARVQHTMTTHQEPDGLTRGARLDGSARTRLALWAGAIQMMKEHPFIGVGYNMFHELIYSYVPHNDETAGLPLKRRDAHNAYFLIGAEMGIPTLLIFMLLLLNMLRVTFHAYRASIDPFWKATSLATMCTVLSLMMTNLFGSRVISLVLAGYLWGLLAIMLKVPAWQKHYHSETVK
jgi:O-antigen ligase